MMNDAIASTISQNGQKAAFEHAERIFKAHCESGQKELKCIRVDQHQTQTDPFPPLHVVLYSSYIIY